MLHLDRAGDVLATCSGCGQKNRLAPARLHLAGRCGRCEAALPPVDAPLDVGPEAFDRLTRAAAVPVLVDFWAGWCGPCVMAAPEVKKLAHEAAGRLLVLKVDTDAHPDLAARFGVQGIPNFVVLRDGRPVRQQAGAMPAEALARLAQV